MTKNRLPEDGQTSGQEGNTTQTLVEARLDPGADDAVVVDETQSSDRPQVLPLPIVGIGGSAGSLQAYIELFENLPADTGMAFVVVLHLAAHQESHLKDIIARHTAMPVQTIERGIVPEPNRVYILPPNAIVSLQQGTFHLDERPVGGHFLPVDILFQSMASEQKNYAIGVVLSGMDGDGAIGLRMIKGEGGISMVQTPESARHPQMPRSSIAGDHVDMVLPPHQIAKNLADLGKKFAQPAWRQMEEGDTSPSDERDFLRILRALKGVSGIDFRLYKPTTIRRRIARRMLMNRLVSLSEYVGFVQGNLGELRDLQEDILINVTRFFRDPDVFEALKATVIPAIFQRREPDQQVRIWVAGCSTGEEAYSIAMCLLEHMTGQTVEPSIQIFGTDASQQNIDTARLGIYPESISNDISPERLRRFFVKMEKGFQVVKRVRDLCIFARQNLSTDPPFSRLDMVSCRNVLIYFGAQLQRQVISTFHYALRPEGYLLLGNSETIREYTDLFGFSDRTHKVFERSEGSSRLVPSPFPPPQLGASGGEEAPVILAGEALKELDLTRVADRIVLARYGPAGVVVNERMEILQSRGRTGPFLELGQGVASLQLSRMMRDSLAPEVTAAVRRSIDEDLPVQVSGLEYIDGDQRREVRVEVLPMHFAGITAQFFLVIFLPQGEVPQAGNGLVLPPPQALDNDATRALAQLQYDLNSTKLYLQSLLDERESKNQELVSANEEIQSSNEEMQSTNEELETTKEELQSSNEELQTVNDELQNRNEVLQQASDDLSNLLNSVNLPVLMLSSELYIRHFTPQAQRLLSVRASDIGRPFGEIRLELPIENLEAMMVEVLETLTPKELEVQDRDGRWHILRVRPYRTTENKIEGLVLVLVDIDQHRRSQQELREARDFTASVLENIPLPLTVVDSDLRIRSMNQAFLELSGQTSQALAGRVITDLAAMLWGRLSPLRELLERLGAGGERDSSAEFAFQRSSGGTMTLRACGRVLQPSSDRYILITFEDITAQKEVENLLKREGERLASQVALTTKELDRSRQELRALTDDLLTSQEDERRRLARELHDDVSQRLALLDMDCDAALSEVGVDPGSARLRMVAVRAHIAEVSGDVRNLSHRLHPSIIEHLGASAALESLLDEFARREGMLTTMFTEDVPEEIPLEVATGLYRITQEALRNVVKHAGRTHVKLSLTGEEGALHLQIADSGNGFDTEQQSTGLGLISMKERARLMGATLTIQSTLREGTRLDVRVPRVRTDVRDGVADGTDRRG